VTANARTLALLKRPLGEAQLSALDALCRHGSDGSLHSGSPSQHFALMMSLVNRGLATRSERGAFYPSDEARVGYAFVLLGVAVRRWLRDRALEAEAVERERRRPVSLARIFHAVSEEEARAIYDALAQWADNERCGVDEDVPETKALVSVEGVVSRLEADLARLALTDALSGCDREWPGPADGICPHCGAEGGVEDHFVGPGAYRRRSS